MTEFKKSLEDQVVNSIGYNKIEDYLNKDINQIVSKPAARGALNDLEKVDLRNDEKWMIARENVWGQEGYRYTSRSK